MGFSLAGNCWFHCNVSTETCLVVSADRRPRGGICWACFTVTIRSVLERRLALDFRFDNCNVHAAIEV